MKMTEKTKRRLAVLGGAAICAGLLAAISLQLAETPAGEDELTGQESGVAEAIIDPSHATEESGTGGENEELAIQPDAGQGAGETQTGQPTDSRPAQTGEAEHPAGGGEATAAGGRSPDEPGGKAGRDQGGDHPGAGGP